MAQDKQDLKIFTDLVDMKSAYETDKIEIVPGLTFSQVHVLKMCEFYSNSTYMGPGSIGVGGAATYVAVGKNKDLLGRDKPFYNIVNFRVQLAKTATDRDIKDFRVTSDDPAHWVKTMFLNKEIYKWMKDSDFSLVLNQMGATRPKYGGYLIKKTLQKGKLTIDVVEWKNVITDQIDILNNPIIETHFMTPIDLMKKAKVWDNVQDVIKANEKLAKKGKTPTIKVYEILGEFPYATIYQANGEPVSEDDKYDFCLQKYFIAEVGEKKYLMWSEEKMGEAMTDTYEYLAWETMAGRALGRGVIEEAEEAQVYTNDAVINEKNAMDLGGKVVLKTTSKKLANNVLEVDNGKIFELGPNEDLETLQLAPAALGEFEAQINRWKAQANDATSSYDATTGKQPPADTPYSQTAFLNQVGSKPFDYRGEEWDIHLSSVFKRWVLPHVIKKLYAGHTLASDFTDDELEIIDRDFATDRMNKIVKNVAMETGQVPSQEDYATGVEQLMSHGRGNKRYIEFPDGYFDDVEAGITIVSSNEQKNKAVMLQSLSTILQSVMKTYDPASGKFMILENPKLAQIFGTILELSGTDITPASMGISLATINAGEKAAKMKNIDQAGKAGASFGANAPAGPAQQITMRPAPVTS